ncbi:hypothetical protein CVT25_006700 [Psilocybe cyanescens]|uniref:Uncharacterized protein n=1 Tax=Psilocybe cyanescens TaxID=93625 RepID=A0A409X498_PSICY|nr:hypothetical protein CVT25_006700 [Psilocybe cyanescens]
MPPCTSDYAGVVEKNWFSKSRMAPLLHHIVLDVDSEVKILAAVPSCLLSFINTVPKDFQVLSLTDDAPAASVGLPTLTPGVTCSSTNRTVSPAVCHTLYKHQPWVVKGQKT